MNWNTYALYTAIALPATLAALLALYSDKTSRSRRGLTSVVALASLIMLGSELYGTSTPQPSNSKPFNPDIEVPTITEQNKAQIIVQAQTDLKALLSPLWQQFEINHPGDYRSFTDFKQKRWLKKSAHKTEYYTALLASNQAAIATDPRLYRLFSGFDNVNRLATLMEQTLINNGMDDDLRSMARQIETLL